MPSAPSKSLLPPKFRQQFSGCLTVAPTALVPQNLSLGRIPKGLELVRRRGYKRVLTVAAPVTGIAKIQTPADVQSSATRPAPPERKSQSLTTDTVHSGNTR